ncbi:FliH/SctL family protein [Geoalkalibacter sp.]|uniref:FliH/SctL family protein n=1 Tax=Geoalkalibacter sp. TaxID=3041440 RepID=UPI00272E46A9|nr:flagellar assembly protein FliH [Geoalkalibacter sp.]
MFRLSEPAGLKTLRFLEFDAASGAEASGGLGLFVEENLAATATVIESVRTAPANAGATREQLAEAQRQGRQQALDEAAGELVRAADALSQALAEISRLRAELLKNSAEDMVRLVMAVAEQVIDAEIAVRPEFIQETLAKAMQHVLKADEYQIRVHPADLALVTERKPLFLAAQGANKNIRVEADASISRGGCVVDTSLGQVDATIESQLAEIRQRLLDHLGGG